MGFLMSSTMNSRCFLRICQEPTGYSIKYACNTKNPAIHLKRQIQEHRQQIKVPAIKQAPGGIEGAQFKFKDLLVDTIKREVQY